ncbi:MAG: peptide chain release factor N(5)-glutamine methyltransferase [Nostocales cyanobacterium]|nr:MAG: peptide chain release factor N(5)-glutamine methyltransferase [Nostocales cyanobacterium]TAF15157.1 MAG: peptide chain release factor N(5)-glutamine methyltransferase [Nostocales cyanobacterium]
MIKQSPAVVTGLELWQWRNVAIQSAIAHNVSPSEVDWLLQEIADLDKLTLRLESFKTWTHIKTGFSLEELNQLWEQRLHQRVPIQYLAGVTPWRKFQISVSSAVLIPRPETEILIDLALAAARENGLESGHWADLGTGSGAIALGLADVLTNATIHAVDFSEAALTVAQSNAKSLGFEKRIKFYQGSWWQPLEHLKGKFAGMVSNPPYIPSDTVLTLQPEVVNHEPHLALDGGSDGLDCIRHLIRVSGEYLQSGGVWLIEMMDGQADKVKQLLEENGNYDNIAIHNDLAGIERFASANRR